MRVTGGSNRPPGTGQRRLGIAIAAIAAITMLTGCAAPLPSSEERTPAMTDREPAVRPFTVTRDDITLAGTLEIPPIDAGQRVPLVILMHGFTGTGNDPVLRATARALTAAGIAAIRFDFDGNGQSTGQHVDMTIPAEIADARAIVDYARTLPFVTTIGLAGHSMGGVVAAMLAGDLGDAVAALVLFAPAVGLVADAQAGTFFGNRYDPADPPASVSAFGFRLGREFLRTAASLPLAATAARFTGPVDLIQGTADALVPADDTRRFAAVYQDARLELLDRQDHEFIRDPAAAGDAAAEFFAAQLR